MLFELPQNENRKVLNAQREPPSQILPLKNKNKYCEIFFSFGKMHLGLLENEN